MKIILLVAVTTALVLYADACQNDKECNNACFEGSHSKCVAGICSCIKRLSLRQTCTSSSDCPSQYLCTSPYQMHCLDLLCVCLHINGK